MSKLYSSVIDPAAIPQTEPIPGKKMVKNNAGGYGFKLNSLKQLERFLVLGVSGNTYYVGERKLAADNAQNVLIAAKENPLGAVNLIVDISVQGRAPKNDPAIFALAMIASQTKDSSFDRARIAALEAVPQVCRIGTHLFQFIEYATKMRGWGRGLRNAVSNYYLSKGAFDSRALGDQFLKNAAYDLVKYQNRESWSHRDTLRLAHSKIASLSPLFKWATKGLVDGVMPDELLGTAVEGFELAKNQADPGAICRLIRNYGLTREMIPTQHLNDKGVWEALFENMPLTAMLRNLNKMTSIGLLTPNSDATIKAVLTMTDSVKLKKARVHPLQLLTAWMTYRSGHGVKGNLTWTPLRQITDALQEGFYAAFGAVEPTNKRFLLSIDVSGSMTSGDVAGVPGLTPNMAAACMAMVTMRTEPFCIIHGFATQYRDLKIGKHDSLEDVMTKTQISPFGGTDCAIPAVWATKNKVNVDCFVNYTDSETWAGPKHASVALKEYRQKLGINAGCALVGMTSTGNTVNDPTDERSLDVVGFDTTVPDVLRWLALGE